MVENAPKEQVLSGFFMAKVITDTRHSIQNFFHQRIILLMISMMVILALWGLISAISGLPAFILPSPALVWSRFWDVVWQGSLVFHAAITLGEVLAGLLIGASLAAALGYLLARSPAIEQIVGPYVVASQAIPIVAIAPLLVLWFGPGIFSKVIICALIVFFPVLINTIVGLRSVPYSLYDLMRSLQANRWQTFRLLEVPASLPVFLGGLRIGATLSVIGAVVGEFVGADRGMGFLINVARGQYDTALVFVAVLSLIALALLLYGGVIWLEAYLLAWQHPVQK